MFQYILNEMKEGIMLSDELQRFIESWGAMGVMWGINRSMARIHAYFIVTDQPVDLDTLASELNISRGNVSMCLKELRHMELIHRQNIPGDRRDFYVMEQDVWRMFFRIAAARKKREFDPALQALRDLMTEGDTETNPDVHHRLEEIETILSTVDAILSAGLKDEKNSRSILGFLKNFVS